jgi:formiminotetrahydrofolate cyclodeaminase
MLHDRPLPDLLDAFASSDPTPGGGSAAALLGALGASLLAMVAGLPKTKNNTPEERATLDAARVRLLELRQTLMELIDRDAGAYDRVVAAFRLPKTTDEDKAARKAAVQDAMKHATTVPLETLRTVSEGFVLGQQVVAHGNPSASSDVAVAVHTLMSGMTGAWLNVAVNLESVTDDDFKQETIATAKRALDASQPAIEAIWSAGPVRDLLAKANDAIRIHGRPA